MKGLCALWRNSTYIYPLLLLLLSEIYLLSKIKRSVFSLNSYYIKDFLFNVSSIAFISVNYLSVIMKDILP